MREIQIMPSLLSADFGNLSKDINAAEACGASALHCDIMDGHFVPNITFGPMIVKAVRSLTNLALHVHLMIEHPERYLEAFVEAGASEITVHAENGPHLHRVIEQIKGLGLPVGVAINPSTPLCAIGNVINDIDLLLIMTVNPGFGGQRFISDMLPKIEKARQMGEEAGADFDIAVDGGIDVTTAPMVVRAGANVLIAGAGVFGKRPRIMEAFNALKAAAESAVSKEA
ncbi:MAG: ribulose-phosphate 3-epimerase [Armatimonadetes bacterium]|nr:ribulose-phosphate 3-epimerase [Armatimonadota bacterium]